jgi:hypothetical protein
MTPSFAAPLIADSFRHFHNHIISQLAALPLHPVPALQPPPQSHLLPSFLNGQY